MILFALYLSTLIASGIYINKLKTDLAAWKFMARELSRRVINIEEYIHDTMENKS